MPDNIKSMIEHCAPFVVAANQGDGPKLNMPRIIEAVIIAGVLGGLGWMFLIPELKTEFSYMKRDIGKIADRQELIQKDINTLKVDAAVDRARHVKE